MAKHSNYRLGSIWVINFDPSVGTEIRKTRPGLMVKSKLIYYSKFNLFSRGIWLCDSESRPLLDS